MDGRFAFCLLLTLLCGAHVTLCQVPDPICLQPKKVGNCRASIPRFYYDSATGQCTSFAYGGCEPNENNFNTTAECQKKCEQ